MKPRSPEARARRAPTRDRILSAERRRKREQSYLIARALRFALGSRRGGVDLESFTESECVWMAATAERLEQS